MRIIQKWSLPILMVSFISICPVASAVNLYLRSGINTCIYDGNTSQTLQSVSGSNQTSIAFSAQTNTFNFYAAPLTNAVTVAAGKYAGGTIGVQNNTSADFQFNASEVIYDYDPTTGNQTKIIATSASGWATAKKNGKTGRAALPQARMGASYTIPTNHLLEVTVTVAVNISSGINAALAYNAPGGSGKSVVQFPTDSSVIWPFGPFATTPNATITAPSSVQQNSTGNMASVISAGAGATYVWSITNGTITAGQSTRQITWTAGASGAVGLGVSIVDSCFSASGASTVAINAKSNQTVTFNPIPTQTYGNSPVTLVATASSGLAVTFSVFSGPASVSGSTLTITGAGTVIVNANQAGNSTYNPGVAQQSFVVNPATLTVTGITATNKVYDGTTTAAINTNSAVLVGVISGDSVTLDLTYAAGYFTNDIVGTSEEVDISGLDIIGASAGNYTLVQPITSANMTPAGLTVSGLTASDKVYDGTTVATLNTNSAALVGVMTGDNVTLDTSSAAGVFADKNVGAGKAVTISGVAIAGADSGNYTLTQPAATASITAFPLTVSATGVNKVYDGTAAATVTLSDNRVSGDSLSTSYTSASFSDKNVGTGKTVSVTGISVTGADAGNYSYNTIAATTANITAATVSGSITAANKVYDGTTAATIASRSLTGVIGSDSVSLAGGTATFSDKNVGTGKTVTATGLSLTGTDAGNYSLASTSATTTANISVATLTVTANNTNRTYGAANPVFTASYSGFVNGEDTSVLSGAPSLTTTATASSGVAGSPYTITASQGTLSAANYNYNFVNGNLTVTAAALTVTANSTNRIYGTANPALTASYSGFVNGEGTSVLSGAPSLTTTATASSGVAGSPYTITAAQGTLSAANYSFNFVNGNLTVTAAALTVTANNTNRTYGAANPAFTASYSGFVNGEDTSVLSGAPSLTTTATASSGVAGSPYTITASQGTLSAANYNFNFVNGNLTVTAAALTVTANNTNRAYGAANPAFTASYSGFVNGEDTSLLSGAPSLTSTATPSSGVAGSPYTITAAQGTLSAANYSFNFVNGNLTVTAAALTVTANNTNRIYGAANPVFTASYSGFVNGENASVLSGAPSLTTTATASSGVGGSPYSITAAQGTLSAANYSFNFVNGNLTVTAAALTVTANNTNRAYGAANPAFTASYSGFVNGENASVLSGAPSLTTTATASSGVAGSPYAITAAQGTLSAANYSFNFVNGNLTVTAAALTVTANNTNRTYGAANPAFTASYSGFVNGENASVLSGAPSLTTTATTSSGVGGSPYSITAAQGTLTAANYSFNFVNGNLTITAAALTVTANNTNRAYGALNPAFTASYSGFVNGDNASVLSGTPSLTTTATPSSSVAGSPYPISPAQGTLNAANYSFSYVNGNLSIAPATLTVSADNKSRPYGMGNPALTASYSGFANGETTNVLGGSPNLSTVANSSSALGPYPIQIGAGTLSSGNYNFSLIDGTLTVSSLPSVLSIRAAGGSPNTVVVSTEGLAPSSTYHVLVSTNLNDWSEIGTALSTVGGTFSYTNNVSARAQFYRIYGP